MKLRLIALFIISQIFCLASYASETNKITETEQTPLIGRVTPSVSYIISTLYGGDSTEAWNQQSTGYGIGATVDIGRSNLVLETGLLYQQLGIVEDGIFGFQAAMNLNYLAIPIEAKYYFSGQNETSWYVKGGVLPSFLVSKNLTLKNDSFSYNQTRSDFPANGFYLPAVVGVGGKINISKRTALILETTYIQGLTSALNMDNRDYYNTALSFTTGIDIAL